MAVTTTYEYEFVTGLDIDSASGGVDLTELSGGGFAAVGNTASYVDFDSFDDALQDVGVSSPFNAQNAALDQLTNGKIVSVGETAGGLSYRFTSVNGSTVTQFGEIGDPASSRVDVAALSGGGFVITSQDNFTATDNDIDVRIRDADGAVVANFSIDGSVANDTGASVAGLNDGGFAVAWTRTVGADSQMWMAVYEANGAVRLAKALQDSSGTLNTDVSVIALDNGGFALAYTDNGWDGSPEITLARYTAAGGFVGYTQVTDGSAPSTTPSLTKLSNGMLAVGYVGQGGDHDILGGLVDADTGALLIDGQELDTEETDTVDPSTCGWGLAGLALAYTGGTVDAQALQLARTVIGDAAADAVTGDDAVDRMSGGGGADTLSGMANNDVLDGQGGADTLLGGDGDDLLRAGADNDSLDGGLGADTADYTGSAPVTIDLGHLGQQNTVGSGLDRFVSVENVIGTSGADSLSGGSSANSLSGAGANDTLAGVGGADTLDGGGGMDNLSGGANDDVVYGGFGADFMSGGGGIDTLDYSLLATETFLDLSLSGAQNTHSAGADSLIGFENVSTGGGADRLRGNGSNNLFTTLNGADTTKAGGGDDTILSGDGEDVLNGGGDADRLVGQGGRDEARGGAGADTFVFASSADGAIGLAACDVIRDFRTSDNDGIDLSGVYAGTLTYIGSAEFGGGGSHEVRVTAVAEGQLVQVDSDGDGDSNLDILVTNSGLSGGAADFVL